MGGLLAIDLKQVIRVGIIRMQEDQDNWNGGNMGSYCWKHKIKYIVSLSRDQRVRDE